MFNLKRSSYPQANAGFTLLEMLVVIIMLGILAAIAAPGWLAYANRQRMNRARTDLVQILQSAQSEAQQNQSNRVITITANNPPTVKVASTATATGLSQEVGGDQNDKLFLTGTSTSVTFDYRGTVDPIPFILSVTTTEASNIETRCVVIGNILGSIKQAEGETQCDPDTYDN